MEPEMMTRAKYLDVTGDRTAAHQQYYGQFVTDDVRAVVAAGIGRARIMASTDPNFNDIPLKKWDMLHGQILDAVFSTTPESYIRAWGETPRTLCFSCCVAKQAARQIRCRM